MGVLVRFAAVTDVAVRFGKGARGSIRYSVKVLLKRPWLSVYQPVVYQPVDIPDLYVVLSLFLTSRLHAALSGNSRIICACLCNKALKPSTKP